MEPDYIRKYGILSITRTKLRNTFIYCRWVYLTRFWGMNIHRRTLISLQANLDRSYPKGIFIDEYSAVSFGAVILTHDAIRGLHLQTKIGKYCQVGARSILMPGIKIGDNCVIGAGTVVTKDVPDRSIVVGNPGKIIRKQIMTSAWGVIVDRGSSVDEIIH